ncbi:MAG: hypothetical protein MK105_15950 [Crocinitomicaceae bacterium]|nr:hypothetical protein [Crocinitomicaceae bacterium]
MFWEGVFSTQFTFSQDKALYIDQTGKVGVNTITPSQQLDVNGSINLSGDLNGTKFYQFTSANSPYVMNGVGTVTATFTVSMAAGCESPGFSALVNYHPSSQRFTIASQSGTGNNHVKVSPKAANTLQFFDECGSVTNMSFSKCDAQGNITVTVDIDGTIPWAYFKIMSQGW